MSSSNEAAVCSQKGGPSSRKLFAEVYTDLRQMAARELRRCRGVVSPTTLVHETFLNLSHRQFADAPHFLAYAARAMRGLIISQLRSRSRQKRGGEVEILSLPAELPHAEDSDPALDALSHALEELAKFDARLAECVDLKFICGFSLPEIARMWNVSERTAQRDWDKARLLLHRLMQQAQSEPRTT